MKSYRISGMVFFFVLLFVSCVGAQGYRPVHEFVRSGPQAIGEQQQQKQVPPDVKPVDEAPTVQLEKPVTEVQVKPAAKESKMETFHYKAKNYRASFLADTVKLMLSPAGIMQANDDLNVIIVTDDKDSIASIKDLLKDMDQLPQQIVIQAKVLKVNDSLAKDNGVNIAQALENSSYSSSIGRNVQYGKDNDEVEQRDYTKDIDYGDEDESFRMDNDTTKMHELDVTKSSLARLSYSQLSDLVNFLVTNQYAEIMAEPKIVTINNRTGKVFIGDRVRFASDNDIDNYGGNINMADFAEQSGDEAGLVLEVTPYIGDSDYITLDIKTGFGSISVAGTNYVKSTVSEAKSSVIVKSGEPIVIGGYKTQEKNITKYKFPVLGNLPLLKSIFSKKETSVSDVEMVLILIPEIVKPGVGLKDENEVQKTVEESLEGKKD